MFLAITKKKEWKKLLLWRDMRLDTIYFFLLPSFCLLFIGDVLWMRQWRNGTLDMWGMCWWGELSWKFWGHLRVFDGFAAAKIFNFVDKMSQLSCLDLLSVDMLTLLVTSCQFFIDFWMPFSLIFIKLPTNQSCSAVGQTIFGHGI